jgi:hypothetical protein
MSWQREPRPFNIPENPKDPISVSPGADTAACSLCDTLWHTKDMLEIQRDNNGSTFDRKCFICPDCKKLIKEALK